MYYKLTAFRKWIFCDVILSSFLGSDLKPCKAKIAISGMLVIVCLFLLRTLLTFDCMHRNSYST